jgi:uncharacterized protein
MKYLVLLAILAVVMLLFFGRGRGKPPADRQAPPPPKAPPQAQAEVEATEILACAHCGVHLPRSEAVFDLAGRPYCGPEHRASGPR